MPFLDGKVLPCSNLFPAPSVPGDGVGETRARREGSHCSLLHGQQPGARRRRAVLGASPVTGAPELGRLSYLEGQVSGAPSSTLRSRAGKYGAPAKPALLSAHPANCPFTHGPRGAGPTRVLEPPLIHHFSRSGPWKSGRGRLRGSQAGGGSGGTGRGKTDVKAETK